MRQQAEGPTLGAGHTLGTEEVAVYRWLALHRRFDPARMAAELELREAQVTDAVDRLCELGLLQRGTGGDGSLRAVDPHLAAAVASAPVERAIREQEISLRALRDQFAQLSSHYEEGLRGAPATLETIPALSEVRAALDRAAEMCREEMITVQPGGTRAPEVLKDALARDSDILGRGVRIRTLYHHTARFNSPSQAYVALASALGAEYRTAHQLCGRMIVFDRSLAFLPDHRGTWGAVAIREPSVVHFLCELFEQAWTEAQPFSDAATDGLEAVAKDLDRTILRLLATGRKDETIARRLGMSLRTTRKHIADIMQMLGAESRFQAGFAVAARGLLRDDEPEGDDVDTREST
ncbi:MULTISPECIES: LuxR C-terminal-related transcriptional regulator [unclassified Streptomyces]|uniref:helix-turn-helix transcriptional regulator n=1 Tax=Streptomyces sp. SID8367 TaxID=2690349 RepID=UPI0021ACDC78|nr:LuxR C-terminal-related transcriptional regulator [Streptomyces sp. PsTaAH-137]